MLCLLLAALAPAWKPILTDLPPTGRNDFYVSNRAPLTPSAFQKLPIGAIKPEGWVRTQLRLEADGFVGHLTEISGWLKKKNNAWLSPSGEGENGWEEVPYWLKGFGDLGYVLNDPRIKAEARIWIEAVLKSQRSDGWFGPASNLTANKGKPDVWPNMVMLFALQSYNEWSNDPRVLKLMSGYFRWELDEPEQDFMTGYWDNQRGGDNLTSVFWLYNRTGEPWLLDLAKKIHEHTAPWANGVPDWHGVNFAQAFREPATYAALSHDPKHRAATEKDYQAMRTQYGEVPGGMYGADENARKGFHDPRQAAETCAMVEMMASDELLFLETGDPKWAERCEDVTFNSLPASMTADERALHYLTAPNMPLADAQPKNPGIQNGGPMLLFDPNDHRCCQHNVAQGWPYYAEHLWMATGGNGLIAALYAPCEVTAKVGKGQTVTIHEDTKYPFEEEIHFSLSIHSRAAVSFPLTLRLPSWCDKPTLSINGRHVALGRRASFATLNRAWKSGDQVVLRIPMQIRLHHWPANGDSVSVERGPLTYSLLIGEETRRHGGSDAWPAYQITPTTAWNYGLIPDVKTMKFRVALGAAPSSDQIFESRNCAIAIYAKARRIPQWQLDNHGLLNTLQPSPALSKEPIETVILIPMGAARLRISSFPTVTDQPSGHVWQAPVKPKTPIPASSSHTYENDTTTALSDGLLPASSGDQTIPRFTWWPNKGSNEWVEYDFSQPRTLSHAEVYWFDDRDSRGGCRVPASWFLEVWTGAEWRQIAESEKVSPNKFNAVDFPPVTTSKLRLVARLQAGFSAGILEWSIR